MASWWSRLGDQPFSLRPERLIGIGRLIFAAFALLAIFLDPTRPARNVWEIYGVLAAFRDYYGPTVNAFEAATSAGREEELHAELGPLFDAQNRATDGRTEILATHLRVTVHR